MATYTQDRTFTQAQWAQDLLARLGYPQTKTNVAAIIAWEYAEGGHFLNKASFNPLDTTLPMPGSHPMNSVGVQAYPDYETGMQATIKTLLSGSRTHGYSRILSVLQHDQGGQALAQAVGSTPWGSNPNTIVGALSKATKAAADYFRYGLPVIPAPHREGGIGGITQPIQDIGSVPGGLASGAVNAITTGWVKDLFSSDVAKLAVRGLEVVGGALLMAGGMVVLAKVMVQAEVSNTVKGALGTATAPVQQQRTKRAERRQSQQDDADEVAFRRAANARSDEPTHIATARHQREQRQRYRKISSVNMNDVPSYAEERF